VQTVVIPLSDKLLDYARTVTETLRSHGIRVQLDDRNETMQAKIRDAQLQQVPYMAVVGPREAAGNSVAVRHRREGDLGMMPMDDFVQRVRRDAERRGGPEPGNQGGKRS
jgi:threonyl-tRNA synthetase